jgi:iron complex outermembrane recepter protein
MTWAAIIDGNRSDEGLQQGRYDITFRQFTAASPEPMTKSEFHSVSLTAAIAAALAVSPVHAERSAHSQDAMTTIVVTADPLGNRTADELIQPVSVLFGAGLERRRAATLGELLDGVPGVSNADFGPGVGRPVVRGLQGSRVEILEDGLRTADVSGEGADHAIAIDPSRADQVEVFRGPSTLLYGSGAAGGVVNVRTGRFNPASGDAPRIDGALRYGENGSDRQGHVGLELPAGGSFVFRADGSLRRTDDFSINGFQQIDQTEGRRNRLVNSSIDTDAFSVTGLYRGDRGYVGLGLSTWDTEYGIPENFDARPRDMGGQSDEFERVLAEYDRIDLRGELRRPFTGFTAARLKLAYTQFDQQEVEFEFERTPEGGELDERTVESEFENDEFEGRIELVHEPIGEWRGVLGLQYNHRDFEADDPRGGDRTFYVRSNRTRTASLFVVEERATAFGRLELGARIDLARSSPDDVIGSRVDGVTGLDGQFLPLPESVGKRTFNPFSASAGAIVDLDAVHHLRAALTRAERSPSPEQLYAFGRHAAAGTFEVGDLGLDTENYLNLELGLDRHTGGVRYDLSLFYNRVDDFIFLQSVDDGTGAPVLVNDVGNRAGEGATAGCEPGDDGLCRLRNQLVFNRQGNADFYGAEFSAVADLLTGPTLLSARLTADHVRGKLRSGGDLPRITPTRIGMGFDAAWRNVDISGDYRRVFKQSNTGVAEDGTAGFNLVSMDVRWRPDALEGAQFFLQGRNLLDEDGRLHQSFFKDEAPIIGRSFIAGVRFDFGG